jgi:hypothetical protein
MMSTESVLTFSPVCKHLCTEMVQSPEDHILWIPYGEAMSGIFIQKQIKLYNFLIYKLQ